MSAGRSKRRRRSARQALAGTALTAGLIAGMTSSASAATTASFNANGVLTVIGDAQANTVQISRDAAGRILVNGGAVVVVGGTPTVANTSLIQVFGQAGNDTITLDEANGALPAANLFGGADNDVLTGGSGADLLFGQSGNDTLLGKGGNDSLFGGADNDTLTGGDGDDQVFGQSGNDRMIWNPGDDTDLNEGGDDTDTTEVNGGNGAETFSATANGTRVRFDRLSPAPFTIDIGTTENLTLNANGGDDTFSGGNGLAPLINLVVDGGAGNDTINGGDGNDLLLGGDGNDAVDGNRGNDTALLGAGDDTFTWDPGDGSDIVEGQDGTDTMQFNGANIAENMEVSANGSRVRFTRDIANITMDMNSVEALAVRALGGADRLTVDDLTGTAMTSVSTDLSANGGGDDGAADNVLVNGTNGSDVVSVSGSAGNVHVAGLAALVNVSGAAPATDKVTVNALAGDDVVDASGLAADTAPITEAGGPGDDVLIGGAGNDTLQGEDGDDVLLGGPGVDVLDGGTGSNILIDGGFARVGGTTTTTTTAQPVAAARWLANHIRTVRGHTVLKFHGKKHRISHATAKRLKRISAAR